MADKDGTAHDHAARLLFAQYSRQSPRWNGMSWENLREDTRRLFRREAEWTEPTKG